MVYTQVFALYEHFGRHVLHTGGNLTLTKSIGSDVRVLDFTCTFDVVFYNRGDQSAFGEFANPSQILPVFPIQSQPVPAFPIRSESAPGGTGLEI